MLAKVFIYAALFAGSAFSAITPAPADAIHLVDAVSIAEQRGIDVHAEIPDDATPIEGGYTFKAGSKAADWVRAQIQLADSPDVGKRGIFAGIAVALFTGANCGGDGAFTSNVQYDNQNVAPQFFSYISFSVSGRKMRDIEQLDISMRRDPDLCEHFLTTYRSLDPGCYNSLRMSCFRLTHT